MPNTMKSGSVLPVFGSCAGSFLATVF